MAIGDPHRQHNRLAFRLAVCTSILWLAATGAAAQPAPQETDAQEPAPRTTRRGASLEKLPDCGQGSLTPVETDHFRYTVDVECTLQDGVRVTADVIDLYLLENSTRITATGNVAFTGPEGHVAAERLDYDTGTGTGTFLNAHGFLALGPDASSSQFMQRDTDVYFEGERLERVGPRRYVVSKGRWTTCEQPTPRWQMVSSRLQINLEDYVIARNTVLRVKNVPVMFVPWLYYPIQDDDRSTGFLMPSYGNTNFRGNSLSNAFFWVLGRSHDATFFHDYFRKAGQGAGAEYRYIAGPGSSGNIRPYFFFRKPTSVTDASGVESELPGSTSFALDGTAIHQFSRRIVGRARFNYFTDVRNQQLLQQNIYDSTQRNRLLEGGVSASFGPLSTSTVYQRNDVVNTLTDRYVYGSTPRTTASLAPQPLFNGPMYASMTADFAYQPNQRFLDGELAQDDSFGRFDVSPSVRVPLSRLPFLSVNQSAGYHYTYYSRQAGTDTRTMDGAYVRQYADSKTEIVGPVFNRIFDLSENAFAERLKHVVEPAVILDLTSPISNYDKTPTVNDISDFIVGNSARVTYRLTNRLLSRGRTINKLRGATREILTFELQQTFYTAPKASRYDSNYVSSQGVGLDRDLSPIALDLRFSPTTALDVQTSAEFDTSRGYGMMVLTTGATVNRARTSVTVNFSRQRFNPTLDATSFVNASSQFRLFNDRVSTNYSLSWDVARSYLASQGVIASYMAQCCGIQAEYQQRNYPSGLGLPAADNRFNMAFVLAGLGTFSNFFGAFGG